MSLFRSLPVRECGLKSLMRLIPDDDIPSLPVRECGLKYFQADCLAEDYCSHSQCGSVD